MFKKLTFLAAVAAIAALVPVASAVAATSITGVVRTAEGGTRAAGAAVYLYRAKPGEAWQNTGIKTTADANGRYRFDGLSNWRYYQVNAKWVYGSCLALGYLAFWDGWGQAFWATEGPRGSDVWMTFQRTVSCY